jgi:hypothetical protein
MDRIAELVVKIADRKAALKEYSKAERAEIKGLQAELEALAKNETVDEDDE